ncbi:MAG: zinc-ribbon domain-containing protein [Acutalibacteraceae bacterium]
MSKYCPRCGAATERNAAFCQNYGAKIPQEQPPAQIQTQIHIIKITVLFTTTTRRISSSTAKPSAIYYGSGKLLKIKSAAVFG